MEFGDLCDTDILFTKRATTAKVRKVAETAFSHMPT